VAFKERILMDTLWHIGKVKPENVLPPIRGPFWNYRHRARLTVRDVAKKGGVLVGFHEKASSYVCDMHACPILTQNVSDMIDPLRELISVLDMRQRMPQIEVAVGGDGRTALVFRHLDPVSPEDMEKLLAFADDEAVLEQLTAVKKANKEALADWLLRTQKVSVNTDAVFDIQSKRLHEYKRQQLNLLYLIHQYYEIKAGHLPAAPLVSIFGAKAAPAYTIAKDIIHALLTLSKVIAADPEVSKWLQVVFVENYNVTAAEKLIPACDLSEQISLASKEASGTGNMKFMLNGALTLGTMDGANVEISQQVGEENIYIFGQTSDQVIHRYDAGDYIAAQWYEGDPNIRRAVDFLTSPQMLAAGHEENLKRLQNELIHKDWFQTLPDFNAYVVRKGQALSDYACDPKGWRRKCLVNIAKAGMFSSDRTIAEYDRDIWHLGE